MKAAVFHEAGKPLQIQELPDLTPGPGELILKVECCGICGTDLHISEVSGALPAGTVLGHEFSGVVAEVGRDAAGRFRIGERVCAMPYIGCGACGPCLTGDGSQCPTLRMTGLGQLAGAYAEYVRVGQHESLHLPDNVGSREGAMVEPLAVALRAVQRAQLGAGARVLVIGGGPIGLGIALWSRHFGARDVVMSELAAGRRELAGQLGATDALDPTHEDIGPEFAKRTGGVPDVIFECVGTQGLLQQCINLAPPRGRIVVVGVCVQPDTIVPAIAILKELDLRFALAYQKRDFELTLALLAQRRISGDAMLSDFVDLAGLPAAFEALKRPTTQCKVMLEF